MPAIFFFVAEHLYGVLVTSNFLTVPYEKEQPLQSIFRKGLKPYVQAQRFQPF